MTQGGRVMLRNKGSGSRQFPREKVLKTVLIRVQRRLSCGLEDHLIEHAQRCFLARAVEPVFRNATAQRFQLPAVRLVLHQSGLTPPVLAEP